jgi:hypothetical protein
MINEASPNFRERRTIAFDFNIILKQSERACRVQLALCKSNANECRRKLAFILPGTAYFMQKYKNTVSYRNLFKKSLADSNKRGNFAPAI